MELGEFALIDRIVARLGAAAAHDILVPPGDDAAAWLFRPTSPDGGAVVATTDAQVEGVHWRRDTMSLADVGWRSVATCISDLAAMGARADQVLLAAQVGPDVTVEDLDAFTDGVAEACRAHNVRIAGGNVARAASTSFVATGIGACGTPMRRASARPGDAVVVSGYLGAAAAGFALIEAGRSGERGAEALIAAHRRPHARLPLAAAAVERGVRCAIDVSDGLLQDLAHIAVASRVGLEIEDAAIPLHPDAVTLLGEEQARILAYTGAEDYELALTGPAATLDSLASEALSVTRIGSVVDPHPGVVVVRDPRGRELHPPAAGWDHLRD